MLPLQRWTLSSFSIQGREISYLTSNLIASQIYVPPATIMTQTQVIKLLDPLLLSIDQALVNLMRKGFEDFERHITLKLNEEKLRVQGELNVQAEMSLKMMDEFRIRITEIENMQNKLNASVDVLDIRTKAGLGSQVPLLSGLPLDTPARNNA